MFYVKENKIIFSHYIINLASKEYSKSISGLEYNDIKATVLKKTMALMYNYMLLDCGVIK